MAIAGLGPSLSAGNHSCDFLEKESDLLIIWINGAFGSGKTTLVAELRNRFPTALVFDPESVGDMLGSIVASPSGDFQDIPLWRTEVAAIAAGLVNQYRRPLLVPMTLLEKEYVAEIFGLLEKAAVHVHHFFIDVPAEVLAARIDGRTEHDDPEAEAASRAWCKQQIQPCIRKARELPATVVRLDGEKPTDALADEIVERVGPLFFPEAT
ncbi:adenylate kinase family enzyme [Streptomyces sp. DSM 42143]|uniref:AAA family ATPase n=1 Tax=Streptomyces TaxID=1883 RepID=UPI002780D5C6|nr:AAA family ATPase [Streptomyces sp. DSM 42143]MDQ0384754.1 adenylate kinase family enzyme [Streptomyces sp. DSM 42143]